MVLDVLTTVDEAAPSVGRVPDAPSTDASDAPVTGGATLAAGVATLAAIVVGMTAAAVYRRGAFYPLDAFGVVVVSLFLVAAALRRGMDRVACSRCWSRWEGWRPGGSIGRPRHRAWRPSSPWARRYSASWPPSW